VGLRGSILWLLEFYTLNVSTNRRGFKAYFSPMLGKRTEDFVYGIFLG
jgi:hypothetical protein